MGSVKEVEEKGKTSEPMEIYLASKMCWEMSVTYLRWFFMALIKFTCSRIGLCREEQGQNSMGFDSSQSSLLECIDFSCSWRLITELSLDSWRKHLLHEPNYWLKMWQPPIHDVESLSALNTSLQYWCNMVVADTPKQKESLSGSSSVDWCPWRCRGTCQGIGEGPRRMKTHHCYY